MSKKFLSISQLFSVHFCLQEKHLYEGRSHREHPSKAMSSYSESRLLPFSTLVRMKRQMIILKKEAFPCKRCETLQGTDLPFSGVIRRYRNISPSRIVCSHRWYTLPIGGENIFAAFGFSRLIHHLWELQTVKQKPSPSWATQIPEDGTKVFSLFEMRNQWIRKLSSWSIACWITKSRFSSFRAPKYPAPRLCGQDFHGCH